MVDDMDGFARIWEGPLNTVMIGDLARFNWIAPPADAILDALRADDAAILKRGTRGDMLDLEPLSPNAFRALPIDRAMEQPFALSHFDLGRFDAPGGILHGFGELVMDPWLASLSAAGFTCDRYYPIMFASGKDCATNWHMDTSHVLAWQVHGAKRFCGTRNPDRWADRTARTTYVPGHFPRPTALSEDDALCHLMQPGDRLWNVLLTPHWVEAADEVAVSFNISHGGLRHHGRLSRNEAELEQARSETPETAPARIDRQFRAAG